MCVGTYCAFHIYGAHKHYAWLVPILIGPIVGVTILLQPYSFVLFVLFFGLRCRVVLSSGPVRISRENLVGFIPVPYLSPVSPTPEERCGEASRWFLGVDDCAHLRIESHEKIPAVLYMWSGGRKLLWTTYLPGMLSQSLLLLCSCWISLTFIFPFVFPILILFAHSTTR